MEFRASEAEETNTVAAPVEAAQAEGIETVAPGRVASSRRNIRSKWPFLIPAFAVITILGFTVLGVVQARQAAARAEWKLDSVSGTDWTRTDGTTVDIAPLDSLPHAPQRALNRLRRFAYANHSMMLYGGPDGVVAIAPIVTSGRTQWLVSGYSESAFFEMVCSNADWQSEVRAFPNPSILPLLQCKTSLRVGQPTGHFYTVGAGVFALPSGWFGAGERFGWSPGNNVRIRRGRTGPDVIVLAPTLKHVVDFLGRSHKIVAGEPKAVAKVENRANGAFMGYLLTTGQGTVIVMPESAFRPEFPVEHDTGTPAVADVLQPVVKSILSQLGPPSRAQLRAAVRLVHQVANWKRPLPHPGRPPGG